jgi:CRISPR-associated protein Cpf1
MIKTSFNKFTNLYPLSKTLRFELKPIGKTEEMLKESKVFEIDEQKMIAYENMKPYLDRLHREFVDESLRVSNLAGLEDYFRIYKEYKKDKTNKNLIKTIESKKKEYRSEIVESFNQTGKLWATQKYPHLNFNKKDVDVLFEENVFSILKEKYEKEENTLMMNENNKEISIFDGWKGFTGYFKKFFETRKNFYTSDGKSTAVATRVIDQNLDRFLDNLATFDLIKNKLDLTEVEKYLDLKSNDVFQASFYNTCLLQEGINRYNEFVGGKVLESGEKSKGINEVINKYRQDNKDQKIPFLKKLDKQILSEKEKFFDEIKSDEELTEVLHSLFQSTKNKFEALKNLLEDFFQNTESYNLSGIYISKEAFNTISRKWTNETEFLLTNLYEALKSKKIISSSAKKKDGSYSFPDFISLSQIQAALIVVPPESKFWKGMYYKENVLNGNETNSWGQFIKIFKYEFDSLFKKNFINPQTGLNEIYGYTVYQQDMKNLLNDFKLTKDTKIIIKNFADSALHIYQMAQYFALEKKKNLGRR